MADNLDFGVEEVLDGLRFVGVIFQMVGESQEEDECVILEVRLQDADRLMSLLKPTISALFSKLGSIASSVKACLDNHDDRSEERRVGKECPV